MSSNLFFMTMISSNFIFNFTNFCVTVSFIDKITNIRYFVFNSFILAVRTLVVAKLVILGIMPLTWFILALWVVLVAKLVILGILSSIFLILALYTSYLTTSFFTKSRSLLKSTKTGTTLSTSNLSTLLFKLLKLVATFFNL